ncbi:MAG: HTTM domain-containing protein [Anaerolineae bacterium]|nr:HTTM domain-containing protein [Phycisphaerae bacterium]
MYWLAFAAKTSADWRSDFSAVYYFLNSHLSTPLGYAIGQLPVLSQLLTIGSLGLELFGPFFALLTYSMPRTRTLIVLGFILFHLGLVATMYVGTFSFICIAAWMIYIPTPMWNAFARGSIVRAIASAWNSFVARIARMVEAIPALAVRTITPGSQNPIVLAFVALLLFYVCIVNLVGTLPKPVLPLAGPLARLPRLKQSWGMMDTSWPYFHALLLEVQQADGTMHTVTRADAPDGSFDRTLPTTQKPDEYWKWPVWRAETTWLVAYRSTLLLGAIENKPQSIEAYCDFHLRKWNQLHPSPAQQAKVIRAYALLSPTKGPDGTRNNSVPSGKQLIYTWPRSTTAPAK